ncbi:MAG: hypothetical protein HQ549_07230 [Candidatus Omnitrophica bacterium]|nr:hypothetical protein [Candidatus Omnitrophota bacterium]
MNYAKKTIVIMICAMLAFPNPTWAEGEGTSSIPESVYRDKGDVMPPALAEFYEKAKNDPEKQKLIEDFSVLSWDIRQTKYNEDGSIDRVIYVNNEGSESAAIYSYEFNGEDLDSFSIKLDNGASLKFSETKTGQVALSMTSPTDSSEDPTDPDEGGPPKPVVTIILPDGPSLEDIARRPFDFEKLIETVKDTGDSQREAYDRYSEDTKPYYEKIYEELNAKSDSFKSEGIYIDEYLFKALAGKSIKEGIKRNFIDDAVEYIYSESKKQGTDNMTILNFLEIEKRYREGYLKFSREIYDKTIEEILEYLNGVIDELLVSDFTGVMKKRDKIVVKLPVPELESEEKKK